MIGRKTEIKLLETIRSEEKPAFVAVYGRRRVGKTFLIRHVFEGQFSFQLTGIANSNLQEQLANFRASLVRHFPQAEARPRAKDWFGAFQQLIDCLENLPPGKKIVFLDELPWLDTPQSRFISTLEHFWNSWASARRDVLLIVCGSAASWMIGNLLNNRGGLHNRVTHRIQLEPFTLGETEAFLNQKAGVFDRYQIVQLYMALGGIPFYLEQVDTGQSVAQNIDRLCFDQRGMLRGEFDNLFASLFRKAEKHVSVIEALAKKAKGMGRDELIRLSKLASGGNATKVLRELEESDFIRRYRDFGKNQKNTLYQLSDFFSLFFLKFMRDSSPHDQNAWLNSLDDPAVRAWSGYAFEQVCLWHTDKIKKALGIAGVFTTTSAWAGGVDSQKTQVDLVIDRRDRVINLCEMKFSVKPFSIDKKYADELRQKVGLFREATGTKKAVFLTLVTTFGLEWNQYAASLVQNSITMDALFD